MREMTQSTPEKIGSYLELHRHLDGSLRPRTLAELASDVGVVVPPNLRFYPGMGLREALTCFEVTLAALQTPEAVERVAAEMCEDARSEGTRHLEIRFAPHLHEGALPEEIVDAALSGVSGRAGLILCGLYHHPPSIFDHLVEIARTRPRVVGIDLAGAPQSTDRWGMRDYASAFSRARDLGIGRTVHAGEGRPPREIRDAIEVLHADRIGHGTTLLDDAQVLDLVLERGVTIEACPTSNVQTSSIPTLEDHPLPRWLTLGVKACICTDNTLFSEVDAPEEHRRARQIPGMTDALIDQAIAHAGAAIFPAR